MDLILKSSDHQRLVKYTI